MLRKLQLLGLLLTMLTVSQCANVAGRAEHTYSGKVLLEKGEVAQEDIVGCEKVPTSNAKETK